MVIGVRVQISSSSVPSEGSPGQDVEREDSVIHEAEQFMEAEAE